MDAVGRGLRGLRGAVEADGRYPARIALALPNVVESAAAYFGVLRAGLVAFVAEPPYPVIGTVRKGTLRDA